MRRLTVLLAACIPLVAAAQQGPGRISDDDLRAWLGTLELEARLDVDLNGDGRLDLAYIAADRNERVLGILDGDEYGVAFGARLLGEAALVPSPTSTSSLAVEGGELVVSQVAGEDAVTATTWHYRHDPVTGGMRLVALSGERYGAVVDSTSTRVQWDLETGEYLVERGESVTLDTGGNVFVYGPPQHSVRPSAPVNMEQAPDPVALLDVEAMGGMVTIHARGTARPVP